jgi:hypothetical protein
MPATAGAAVDLVAGWLRDRTPLPPEVVLQPHAFPDDASNDSTNRRR